MQGVSLGNVSLLRLDQTGGPAPGNKSFKLRGYLAAAERLGLRRLVSFGGAWSNHLHALAAVSHAHSMEAVGIVRGEATETDTAMLEDARCWGMRIVHVSRTEYRRRNQRDYQQDVIARFAPCLLIPEGGASVTGAAGGLAIAGIIRRLAPRIRRIVVPVGTGTTLAGLLVGLDGDYEVFGISALKGATDLESRVENLLSQLGANSHARWRILHEYHCGGFARVDTPLRNFMPAFEAAYGVELEPVYTGKMLFAIQQLLAQGTWGLDEPILGIHTGGLQGRRGYPWLG